MAPNQLFPLEVNPRTQEPFLRLRKHKSVILTPMRWEDAPSLVPLFNDKRVYHWMLTPPFPFSLKDAQERLQKHKPPSDAILQELKDAQGSETLKMVNGAPVCYIRELQEDGSDIFLGNIAIGRCFHGELMGTNTVDWEHATDRETENRNLELGDPKIIWSFGDFLSPSHHGQGIMTDAMDTLLHEWAIPRMSVRRMLTGAFTGNHGSIRVFEKNGFKMVGTIDEFAVVRGEMRGLHVFEWKLEDGA